ncbi:hypothetical protein ACFE04_021000 [Oxalis oulophora]
MAIERNDYENEITLALSRTYLGGASIEQEYTILLQKARLSKYELPDFPIPSHIRELLEINHFPDVLTQALSWGNYTTFFNALLMLEELHLEGEMKPHKMRRVTMKREGSKRYGSVALLVPGLVDRKHTLSPGDIVFSKLASNNARANPEYEEQQCSIKMILGCNGGPPYIIFGPPGTGKTSTLVEAISQVYAMNSYSQILVCSASNSAADYILEKLISWDMANIDENEILRLNSRSRSSQDIQLNLIRFCKSECPTLYVLMRYRIIISTCMNSSVFFNKGIRRGYFSHIFLDEAGQTSEPECMVPISYLCQKEIVVVLAGDPKQLDESYVTKLVRNYRCHPKILDVPSELFYNGELLASKKVNSLSVAAKSHLFPNKEFPILFYGIWGCNEIKWNNPSWFNQMEASKVVEIINLLREVTDLDEADIGVIAPYRQQVVKIAKILKIQGTQKVKVGTMEQFQGQEREVIIVSTVRSTMNVRSTMKLNKFDKIHSLGFLSNPRRFNVAITRAKSLLIIVGNPHVVCQDRYWNKLLRYCTFNNSYVGCTLPDVTHINR